jgi:serine/threonine protein kinase
MFGMNLDEIQDMLGEAILLTHVKHPNIVTVSDANISETRGGTCGYFTMEHVPGGSLDNAWRSHGGQFVPIETAIDFVKQVCGASRKPIARHRPSSTVRSSRKTFSSVSRRMDCGRVSAISVWRRR